MMSRAILLAVVFVALLGVAFSLPVCYKKLFVGVNTPDFKAPRNPDGTPKFFCDLLAKEIPCHCVSSKFAAKHAKKVTIVPNPKDSPVPLCREDVGAVCVQFKCSQRTLATEDGVEVPQEGKSGICTKVTRRNRLQLKNKKAARLNCPKKFVCLLK